MTPAVQYNFFGEPDTILPRIRRRRTVDPAQHSLPFDAQHLNGNATASATLSLSPQEARDEAVAKAERGADPKWLLDVLLAIRAVARERKTLTSEDVRQRLGDKAACREPRAFGCVMQKAAREGIIKATARHRLSGNKTSHNRPMRVWASLIYEEE